MKIQERATWTEEVVCSGCSSKLLLEEGDVYKVLQDAMYFFAYDCPVCQSQKFIRSAPPHALRKPDFTP